MSRSRVIRIEGDLLKPAKRAAIEADLSLQAWVSRVLRAALMNAGGRSAAGAQKSAASLKRIAQEPDT